MPCKVSHLSSHIYYNAPTFIEFSQQKLTRTHTPFTPQHYHPTFHYERQLTMYCSTFCKFWRGYIQYLVPYKKQFFVYKLYGKYTYPNRYSMPGGQRHPPTKVGGNPYYWAWKLSCLFTQIFSQTVIGFFSLLECFLNVNWRIYTLRNRYCQARRLRRETPKSAGFLTTNLLKGDDDAFTSANDYDYK